MNMKIKYNRTSTINQDGERFKLDKDFYDLTLFDKGVSGKVPFKERENGKVLVGLVSEGKVTELVVEELSRLGRNTVDTLTTLKWLEDNGVNVVVKGRKMFVINGGKLGRKIGTVENRQEFLQKENNQKIISLLDKGKSVRDISGRLGVSTKTIVKVRKYHLC
jgi:DNA invertase Pin-like site-specific DNA recombinase